MLLTICNLSLPPFISPLLLPLGSSQTITLVNLPILLTSFGTLSHAQYATFLQREGCKRKEEYVHVGMIQYSFQSYYAFLHCTVITNYSSFHVLCHHTRFLCCNTLFCSQSSVASSLHQNQNCFTRFKFDNN